MEAAYHLLVKKGNLSENTSFAHRSKVATFFKHYHADNVKQYLSLDEYDSERPDDNLENLQYDVTQMGSDGCVRFQLESQLYGCVFNSQPLKPFFDPVEASEPVADESCFQFHYHPRDFDLDAVDYLHYNNLPRYNHGPDKLPMATTCPGFWGASPFWPNPPAQFGMLACQDLTEAFEAASEMISSNLISPEQQLQIEREFVSANALLTLFAWTSAQAYNQGSSQTSIQQNLKTSNQSFELPSQI
ncbi:mitochondrial ribosomal protein, S30 [Cichlidogyrus casuarinus]|uniref:Mitochondrial ribosomal protein, S30 n=1 Tax=Cichlidogyrus casuarinus TaxID=1844966 RepID=A0ABD2QGT4_9PLAT